MSGRFDTLFADKSATILAPATGETAGAFDTLFTSRPKAPPSVPVPKLVEVLPSTIHTLAGLQEDPLNLKGGGATLNLTSPTSPIDLSKAVSAGWNSIKDSVMQEGQNLKDLFTTGGSKQTGVGFKTIAGAANVALSPITALFSAAETIPVLGSVSKLLALPFTVAGDTAPHLSNAIIDNLPISQEAKDNIKPGVGELFAVASQVLLGKAIDAGAKQTLPSERAATAFRTELAKTDPSLAPDLEKVDANKINRLVENHGLEDAKTIVKQAIGLANQRRAAAPTTSPEPAGKFDNLFSTKEPVAKEQSTVAPETQAPVRVQEVPTEKAVVPSVEGSGPTQVRGLSAGVEAKAIENRLTNSFGDLPEYQTVSMKDQAARAAELISKDYEQARRIAMGEEAPPKDVLPESIFVAVENRAIKEGDVAILRNLATGSTLTGEATTMGQRIRTLAERDPESPVAAIKDIQRAREERAIRTAKTKDLQSARRVVADEIRTQIKRSSPTKQTWDSFVESLRC